MNRFKWLISAEGQITYNFWCHFVYKMHLFLKFRFERGPAAQQQPPTPTLVPWKEPGDEGSKFLYITSWLHGADSIFWKATHSSASQDSPRVLWKPKFHRRVASNIEKNLWPSAKWRWILGNQKELRIEQINWKRRYSEIYKKQKNSLAGSRDADGWQDNTQKC